MNPIGPVNALDPMPTTLLGVIVNGKPNFLTNAHVNILNHGTPQYIKSLTILRCSFYTYQG
jgi:hypothetical protein